MQESSPAAWPIVLGQAVFTLTPAGGLTDLRLVQSSLSPAIDESLLAALRRADSGSAFPLPKSAGVADISRLYIKLGSGQTVPGGSVLLFTIRVPVWRNVTLPSPDDKKPIKTPSYPENLLTQGFSGAFVMGFVIDERGRVVPSTVTVVANDIKGPSSASVYPTPVSELNEFVTAVASSLKGAHYVPATINGCPVKSFAEQPFVFNGRG